MFLAVHAAATAVGVPAMRMMVVLGRYLAGVHVQTVLAFLREPDQERDEIVHDRVRHVLGQPLLVHAVFVQRGHEVGQRLRHAELEFQLATGEHQRVLRKNNDSIFILLYIIQYNKNKSNNNKI